MDEISMAAHRLAYLWSIRDKDPRSYIRSNYMLEIDGIYAEYPIAPSRARKLLPAHGIHYYFDTHARMMKAVR